MIDLDQESLLSYRDAAAFLPKRNGRRIHVSSLYRWATRGIRGVILETLQVGGCRYTSKQALQRFSDRLTEARAVPERSDPPIEVTCATCHHGVTKPLDIRVILAAVATEHGADSAIAQYEAMREEYYGAASYDFRPFMLANVAERIAPEAFDVAIVIAEYNTERYPANDQTYLTMAQMHMARSDTAAAIRALERGIEQNPDNEFFPGLVRRLGGGR